MSFEFDPIKHIYRLDGKIIPSVTQILNELVPIQYKAGDWYLQRGRAVHAAAAFIARGIDFDFNEQIAGQVAAIRKFFAEVKPDVKFAEERVSSRLYRFAGTLDLYAKIKNRYCLIDYKSSISVEHIGLQLAGYAITFNREVISGIGVAIKEDGTYSMTEPIRLHHYEREFLALRATYAVRERLGLNKKEEVNHG